MEYLSDKDAINMFSEILKFPTISGIGPTTGSYDLCAAWILEKCNAIGLNTFILPESLPNKPIVVAEWEGTDSTLPCILFNSHYDVVPVTEDAWNVPTFEGVLIDDKIYGRGAQDMKCVVVQYIVAFGRLKAIGHQPVRTLRLSFVPDEEIGGADGMGILLKSQWFNDKKIAIAFDEGLASEDNNFAVFYGERLPWWIKVTATGNTGHGSRFIEGTAAEQILGVANRAQQFREIQRNLLHGKCSHSNGCSHAVARKTLGDVTTVNLTVLKSAGCDSGAYNVIPTTMEAGFDIRISPHTTTEDISNEITRWCQEAQNDVTGVPLSGGIKWEFANSNRMLEHSTTSIDDKVNPWWDLFRHCIADTSNCEVTPLIFPAATDSRFLRALGIRAFGFSPIRNSPILLHEHNEYLSVDIYLEGCTVYEKLIRCLSMHDRLHTD